MNKFLAAVFLVALEGLAIQPASASVVFTNLNPSNAADDFRGPMLGASILTGSTPISLSDVKIVQSIGMAADETFAVYSRNADGTVGTPSFTSFTLSFDSATKITTAQINGGFVLQANSGYWFVFSSGTVNIEWDYTTTTSYTAAFGVSLPATNTTYGSNGTTFEYYDLAVGPQVFQVDGLALLPVPEPSTWSLAVLSLAGGIVLIRRRRWVTR